MNGCFNLQFKIIIEGFPTNILYTPLLLLTRDKYKYIAQLLVFCFTTRTLFGEEYRSYKLNYKTGKHCKFTYTG